MPRVDRHMQSNRLERIVSESPAMRRVLERVRGMTHADANVLIEAESGTGKELIARAIHETSQRAHGPFIAVDCAALPEGIAEGELFGYERGAFTGAVRATPGLFRSAHGGTLFLDEIGELPLVLQAKLLRALQEREVRPLGSPRTIEVDVRIVAATNRVLRTEVEAGRFRADLYYRLRVVPIALAPLRERCEDIPLLAMHFLRAARGPTAATLEPAALQALLEYPWPGNVRELENVICAAAALAPGSCVRREDLCFERPPAAAASAAARPSAPASTQIELSLRAYERACLEEALRQADGEVRRAARLLGIGRSTLYRKLGEHGLRATRAA
jgi:two-component system response regulator HydG